MQYFKTDCEIDISLVLEQQYQKLRKLYHIADVHGPHDLDVSLEDDSVVVVALVDASGAHGKMGLPKKVSDLTYRSDVSDQQQDQLCALLLKWEKVFPKPDENGIIPGTIPHGHQMQYPLGRGINLFHL